MSERRGPAGDEIEVADLASPERLRSLFHPQSLALVGASDTSGWARNVYQSLRTAGFEGTFVPVHPHHPTVFGISTRPSLRHLDGPVDLVFALVPTDAVEQVVDDAGAAGVRNLVVLAAGYGERGEEGRRRERSVIERATRHGITVLGPNGLGFINATARVAPYGLTVAPPLIPGPVGIVLQSGALASAVQAFARNHGIGVSLLVSMGNEAMVTTADVIEYLIEDPATRVIALFLEGIRHADRFAALARRALATGKAMVVLKIGRSPGGQRTALAHTGAVAGDDAVVDTALRQLGVIRVHSLEELLITAGLLGYGPAIPGPRMGVITASGGACDIIADRAQEEGLQMPAFDARTVAALEPLLPPFTNAQNPVDVTGFGLAHQGGGVPMVGTLREVARDPNLDFVLLLGPLLPSPASPDQMADVEQRFGEYARAIAEAPVPVVPCRTACTDLDATARGLFLGRQIHQLGGLEFALSAIGHSLRWEQHRRRAHPAPAAERGHAPDWIGDLPPGPWAETEGRRLLAAAGVPLVLAQLSSSAEEAVAAARDLGYPVALRVCAAGIAHKTEQGGVALDVESDAAVRAAFA
ncbi:MAG: acetate--CoA ligase family protein, partial [Candidatus Dormibacteraceae bacterium]